MDNVLRIDPDAVRVLLAAFGYPTVTPSVQLSRLISKDLDRECDRTMKLKRLKLRKELHDAFKR